MVQKRIAAPSAALQVGVSTPGLEKTQLIDIHGRAPTPAEDNLFKVDELSKLLDDNNKALFHSNVMALLFMAKRSRPDIIHAISCLTSRVLNPTQQDMDKLMRVMRYLNGTRGKHIVLKASRVCSGLGTSLVCGPKRISSRDKRSSTVEILFILSLDSTCQLKIVAREIRRFSNSL